MFTATLIVGRVAIGIREHPPDVSTSSMSPVTLRIREVTAVSNSAMFERLLLWPRVGVGLVLAVVVPLVSDAPVLFTAACGAALIVVSLVSWVALDRVAAGRRWPIATSAADLLVATTIAVGMSQDESMPAVLLLPLVAAELTLKHGSPGAGIGLGALGVALTGRSVARTAQFDATPRIWFMIAMIALAGLLVALAGATRSAERRRTVAEDDRDRLAALLRETVEAVLGDAGDERRNHHRDLHELVELACSQPELGSEVARRLAAVVGPRSRDSPLSGRQLEVLAMLGRGLSDRDVARELFLSPGTVRVHVSHAVRKLDVADRAAAIRWMQGQHGEEPSGPTRESAEEAEPGQPTRTGSIRIRRRGSAPSPP